MNDTSNVGVNSTGVSGTPVQNTNPMPAGGINPSTPVANTAQVNTGVAMPSPAVSVPQQPVVQPQIAPVASPQPVSQVTPEVAPTTPVAAPAPTPQVAPTPVAPAPQVAPTVETAAPVDSNVQIQMSSNISAASIMEEPKKETKRDKNANKVVTDGEDDTDALTNQNVNRAPIMVVVIFMFFLSAAFIYYYIIMTPYKVYQNAFDNIFNGIHEAIDSYRNTEKEKFKIDLGFDLDTEQKAIEKYASQMEAVDYIDNDYLEGIISLDRKKNDLKVTLRSEKKVENLKKLGLDELIEDTSKTNQKMLDFTVYFVDGQTYIGPIDYINYNNIKSFGTKKIEIPKPIKLDLIDMILGGDKSINTNMFDIDKIEAIYTLLNMTKNKVIDAMDDSEVSRSIGVARIGGTTAVALKSNADVGKEKIGKIHKTLFGDALADKEEEVDGERFKVIDKLMFITGLSREEIVEKLKEFNERDQLIDRVEVKLHMNLANTQLISLWFRVDEKYTFQVSYLNGYYIFHIDIENNGKQTFGIDATYDEVNGIVDGLGFIDNDNTLLGVKFDYNRKLNSEGRKSGNSLVFKFYNNDTFKLDEAQQLPLAVLNCSMDIYDDIENDKEEALKFNLEEEVAGASGIGRYGTDLNKFKSNFISHIDFLVDHLLYNKGDAAKNRKKLGDSGEEIKNEETKPAETEATTTETETKVEETKSTENTETTAETKTEETSTENNTNVDNGTPETVE